MVERNVTRAAARLAMTQPAVSNAAPPARGHPRGTFAEPNGVTPTARREPVLRAGLADSLQEALVPQGFDPRTDARTFKLAMADATAALFVPVLVQALQAEQAKVDLRVLPLTSRDPRPMLEQGQADIALGFFPAVRAELAAEGERGVLRLEALYGCEYVCVMRQGHALAQPGALTLDAYCAADHLRVTFAGRPRGFVDEALAALGHQRR
jgi:DNA-binding transcriptional LysR family regulator